MWAFAVSTHAVAQLSQDRLTMSYRNIIDRCHWMRQEILDFAEAEGAEGNASYGGHRRPAYADTYGRTPRREAQEAAGAANARL